MQTVNTRQTWLRLTARSWVSCLIVVFPFVYFWPATRGRCALLMGDSLTYSVLMRMLLGEFLGSGVLPLWNPYTFAGGPLLATIQPGALYPPNWLFAVLPPLAAMNLVVITTYHVALAGAYRFARSLALDRLPALSAAVIFAFGGFLIGHLEDTNYIAAAAWLPWILLALERLAKRVTWRWIGLGAAFVALQCFAGLPQATWQIMLVSVPYGLWLLWQQPEPPARRRFALALAGLALIGFLWACPQLLPTIEMQQQGDRLRLTYEIFATFSLSWRRWLTLLFPYFFGGAQGSLYGVPGWDQWWWLQWAHGYVGMLGLLGASLAVCLRWRAGVIRFWLVLGLCALFLTLGENLPLGLHRVLYRIPIHNLFRASYRHYFEWNFALGILAGYGWQSLSQLPWKQTRRAVFLSAAWLGLAVGLTALAYRFGQSGLSQPGLPLPPGANAWRNAEFWVPLLCYAASAGALFYAARRRAGWLLFVILLGDLALFGQYTFWHVTNSEVFAHMATPPAIEFIQGRESAPHAYRIVNDSITAFGKNYAALNHGNLAVVRHVHNVQGYDPMRLTRVARLAGGMDLFGAVPRAAFQAPHQGLNLLNAKYLLREATDNQPPPPPERWRKLARFDAIEVYENPHVLPRAWWVSHLAVQPRAAVRQTVQTGMLADGTPFDPRQTALIEQEDLPRFANGLPSVGTVSSAATAQIIRHEPLRITLRTDNPQAGFLVLSEMYYPGWAAWVDERRVPVRRVNYALRGLAVPAGAHRVEFRYEAPSFWRGVALGGLGIVLLLGGAAFSHVSLKNWLSSRWAFSLWRKHRANNPTAPTSRH